MTNNQLTDQKLTKIIESAEAVISALAGHNDDVHPDDSTKMCRLWDALNDDDATPEVVLVMAKDLQERRKADSEPAMYIMGMGHALDVETASTCKGAVDSWVDEWNQRRLPGQAEYKTVPLYRHAQPAPVVSADLLHTAASAIEDLLTTKDRVGAGVWFDLPSRLRSAANAQRAPVVPDAATAIRACLSEFPESVRDIVEECADIAENACRAAMLQDEPVTTANKLPPNSFTDDELEGMAHGNNPQSNAYRELLAYRRNSPVIPDTWIPVSERMPEVGVKVLCFPVEDEPIHASFNGQLWLQDISWSVSDEIIDNVISCNVTHWMPLPAAPQREV